MKLLHRIILGGGILTFAILSNLNAKELRELCPNGSCEINSPENEVTNTSPFSSTGEIKIKTQIDAFINRSTLTAKKINVDSNGNYIANFYNYGRIITTDTGGSLESNSVNNTSYKNIYNYGYISGYVYLSQNETQNTNLVNFGTMGGLSGNVNQNKPLTIDNRGVINLFQQNGNGKKIHFKQLGTLTLQNYAMQISENQATFNGFDGNATNNSHLVVDNVQSVKFADKDSKLILDFGGDFSFNSPYKLDKLIVKADNGTNALKVDFSRLATKTSLYKLTQSGDNFIVSLDAPNSEIGILHKSNIRTMNNFLIMSNSMIYPRKYSKSQNLARKNSKNILSLRDLPTANRGNPLALLSLRASEYERGNPPYENNADSALSLKSYESFAYQNESQNPQTRRIQRQKRNYSRNLNNSSLRDSAKQNRGNPQNQRFSQNLAQNPSDYYFILTPFVNHNLFFEPGRYNLSGFDYGFLTAFSARVAESNSLGAHFMMSYGTLGDSSDKNFHISNLNLNLGLNYKLDLIWDSYLKARGDFFYFLNQVKTLTMMEAIKPNNLGFGASVSYGKDFDFKQGGMLGIEGGLDYKALQSSTISLHNDTYQKQLYNLLYVDLGISYAKYFGGFGLNANLGIKGNITANKLAKSKIILNNFNRSVDMILDNDKILGYANVALSYVLNRKNFDMEFSLAYYGNFGDRAISNGGGFEWRTTW